uniref:Lar family restriction alleviation protein n=1 Tax=Collinsella bouchesdurhonensis TaxID=1907654 RepID=UPI00359C8F0A
MSGNKPDLLPCPFCGGEALNVEWVTSHDERGWAVACKNPECLMNQGARILRTEAEAAEAWNRRAERTCHVIDHGAVGACSACGAECFGSPEGNKGTYCPNCGAKVVEE